MATVTGFTAARMKEIEDAAIVNGNVVSGDLILVRKDGGTFNAGSVQGPPGVQGPTGDVAEAPVDAKLYVRNNNAWHVLANTTLPYNNKTHGLKNGVWTELEIATPPPSDNLRYSMRNGVWVKAAAPWKLQTSNTGTLPSGFMVGTVYVAYQHDWSLKFQGSGYQVNYEFDFSVVGSTNLGTTVRFTLPTILRPITDAGGLGFLSEKYGVQGITTTKIKTNGEVVITTKEEAVGMSWNTQPPVKKFGTMIYEVNMTGSFTRISDDLPNGATPI